MIHYFKLALFLSFQMSRRAYRKEILLAVLCVIVILQLTKNVIFGGDNDDQRFHYSVVGQENVSEIHPTCEIERNLRIISYNIRCQYFNPFSIWNFNERIERLVEGIKDFDIALVQEAYVVNAGLGVISECASRLVTTMSKHGFHYRTSIADFMAPYVGKSGGIAIFSRIPLTRTTSRQFQSFSFFQYTDYMGFVIGEYIVNSRHLYVVNTHLDPSRPATRIMQAKELTSATRNYTMSSAYVILGGDFNIDNRYPTLSNSSEEYIELLRTMKEAGLRSVFPSRIETNIDGGNYDAIFASSNIAVVRKEIIKLETASKALVSDHFGLAIELKLL